MVAKQVTWCLVLFPHCKVQGLNLHVGYSLRALQLPPTVQGHAVSGVRLMMILKFPRGVDMSVNDCLSLYVSP